MSKVVNRYTALIACSLAMLATGVHYVWSILQTYVMEYFSVSSAEASQPFFFFIAINVAGIMIGGRIRDRFGIRMPVLIGSVIYIAGLICSSFVPRGSFRCSLSDVQRNGELWRRIDLHLRDRLRAKLVAGQNGVCKRARGVYPRRAAVRRARRRAVR